MTNTSAAAAPAAVLIGADAYADRLKNAESIARAAVKVGKRYADDAALIVAAAGADYVWSARGAVPAAIHLYISGATKGDAVPAQKDAEKRPTLYGTYVDGVKSHVAALIEKDADEKPAAMRVSLTGVGSAVVPADHPAYALLLALLGAEEEEDAADAA